MCIVSPYFHFPFQELLEEARQGQPEGAWPTEDPFVAIAAKQERLFSALTEFHRRDLEVLEGKIAAISSQVDGASLAGGYVARGTQLHELQVPYDHHETTCTSIAPQNYVYYMYVHVVAKTISD